MDSKDFVLVRTHGLIVHHPDDIALLHPNRLVVSVVVPLDVAPEPLLQPLQQAFLYSHKQSVRDLPSRKQSLRKDTEIASNWRIAKGTCHLASDAHGRVWLGLDAVGGRSTEAAAS